MNWWYGSGNYGVLYLGLLDPKIKSSIASFPVLLATQRCVLHTSRKRELFLILSCLAVPYFSMTVII